MSAEKPLLPRPRGPRSRAVVDALGGVDERLRVPEDPPSDALVDDDLHLALWCCYQLHYTSFAGVDDGWEWEPRLLAVRRRLEAHFVDALVDDVGAPDDVHPDDVATALLAIARGDGPSLSAYLRDRGSVDELREFLVHRSAYQRKEADPHTWMIPRLRGRSKAATVAIQYDEYGEGRDADMHATLFAHTMRAVGLDPAFGAYLDVLPGTTLATDNLVTMFGLHRRWRAACVGHLALFEMTSVVPMARYSAALRRLGLPAAARRFYDVHVEADAVHEVVALDEMVAGLLATEPESGGVLLFGARCLDAVERRFALRLLDSWRAGITSLCAVLPERIAG